MSRFFFGALIYYLPLVFNVLLAILAYRFLPTSEASVLINAQFLSAAGVGVFSSICGQLPLIYSGKLGGAESYLSILILKTAPISLAGMFLLSVVVGDLSIKILSIAMLLTMIDSFLLSIRTVSFSKFMAFGVVNEINFRQLILISLPRIAICLSPLTMNIDLVIFIMVVCLLFVMFSLDFKSEQTEFSEKLGQHQISYLMLAGFLNGCVPYFLMNGVNSELGEDNLIGLLVLRIALAANGLVRLVIDSMIAAGTVRFYEMLISLIVITLSAFVIFLGEVSLVLASLPVLVYVSKAPYLKNIINHHFARSLITPVSLITSYFVCRLYFSEVDSLIAGFLISSVTFMLLMRRKNQLLHHNFLIACLSFVGFIYVY